MRLGYVVGTVVATVKDSRLQGRKILLVEPVDRSGQKTGQPRLALDAVGAGVGEHVFYVGGKEAAFAWYPQSTPCDCTIVGILDPFNFSSSHPAVPRSKVKGNLTGAAGP